MKIPGRYFIYILRCCDQSYYIGVTNDVDRRFNEHIAGLNPDCYSFNRRPLELAYTEPYLDINQAIAREKQLKGWSRKKKEALINSNIPALQYHAMNSVRKSVIQSTDTSTDPDMSP